MPPILRKVRAISVSRPTRVFVDGGASIGISVMFGLSNIDSGNSARKAVVASPHQRADEARAESSGRGERADRHRAQGAPTECRQTGDQYLQIKTGEAHRICASSLTQPLFGGGLIKGGIGASPNHLIHSV